MDEEQRTMSFAPQCRTVAERLAASALGAEICPQEQAQMLTHLRACSLCRRRLDDYATIATVLPLRAPLVKPPADLRARIVAAAQRKRSPHSL